MRVSSSLIHNRTLITLALIILLAIFLRFLYFPENIYFGYDQARDAFISREVLHGKIKIIGPTTSIPGLNHGALFYYLYAPIYLLSQSDPSGLAIFLRVYNSLGIILIFFIGRNLFGKWTGIISALLFAFSYEQTQYSLFMTHPALAVITVLTFYLGMSYLFFKNKAFGLPLAVLGLGLSFQFHFLLAYLFIIFILDLIIFHTKLPKINLRMYFITIATFLFSTLTYIIAEAKNGFQTIRNLFALYSDPVLKPASYGGINNALHAALRYFQDNIFAASQAAPVLLLIFSLLALYFLKDSLIRNKIIFLLSWFILGLISYYINDTSLYFYGIGTSISLLVFTSFLINRLSSLSQIAAYILLIVIICSNLYLIEQNNPRGPNKEINVQTGMLLADQKRALDYMYAKASGDKFAVNAFSLPLTVNTTWAYLFEWYGQKKYGYQPVWGGANAPGYEGNLKVNNSRSTLPYKRFLIIEPIRGSESTVTSFMTNESWFTDIIEEQRFGDIIVDFQKPK